jgi:hypothetical protein
MGFHKPVGRLSFLYFSLQQQEAEDDRSHGDREAGRNPEFGCRVRRSACLMAKIQREDISVAYPPTRGPMVKPMAYSKNKIDVC